jgi:ferredoxin
MELFAIYYTQIQPPCPSLKHGLYDLEHTSAYPETAIISIMSGQRAYIRYLRYAVQLAFLLFSVFIGYRFHQFVLHFEVPGSPYVPRPTSVDGFLPIGGLMSLKYFVFTGIVEPIHPAALVLFVAAIAVSVVAKKGFCGWICPVGTVSEYIWKTGRRVMGRNLTMQKHVDLALRSLKYILLGIFVFLIVIAMTTTMILLFIIADYYKVVDVRMLKFFTEMSSVTLVVLVGLVGLSFLYKNFWCRYLCPYGALLGVMSWLSPFKVRRNDDKCTHCMSCTRNCPALIKVEEKEVVSSPECFGCLTCVSRCPSEGALDIYLSPKRKPLALKPYLYPLVMLAVFYIVISLGMATGNWHSKLPYEEYKRVIPMLSARQHAPEAKPTSNIFNPANTANPANQNP